MMVLMTNRLEIEVLMKKYFSGKKDLTLEKVLFNVGGREREYSVIDTPALAYQSEKELPVIHHD